jgi:hypothetical protein
MAGETVTVIFPDNTNVSVQVASDGSFSVTSETAQGSGAVNIIQFDPGSGLMGGPVNIDYTAPLQTNAAVTFLSNGVPSGNPDVLQTSDGHISLSGTLSAPLGPTEQVQISLDGGHTWQTATAGAYDSHWSFDNTASALPNGLYVAETRVIDTAGNATSSVAVQQIQVSSAGEMTLSLSDVLTDADALARAGLSQKIMLSSGGSLSAVNLVEGVGEGVNQWHDAGTTTINGVDYEVYHNAGQGANSAADILIQHGIQVY